MKLMIESKSYQPKTTVDMRLSQAGQKCGEDTWCLPYNYTLKSHSKAFRGILEYLPYYQLSEADTTFKVKVFFD